MAVLIVPLMCSSVQAQDAKAVIAAPDKVDTGDLLVLDAGESIAVSYEWRVYPFKTTLPVDGGRKLVFASGASGQYRFILAVAKGDAVSIAEHVVIVGEVSPDPGPGPEPGPEPPPVPPGPSGLRVLILRETADNTPQPLLEVLMSTKVREYLNSHAAKGVDGRTPEWRIWDDDYVDANLNNISETWRSAYADAKQRAGETRPWIHVSNGREGYSGPLPATVDGVLELLRKYGGA